MTDEAKALWHRAYEAAANDAPPKFTRPENATAVIAEALAARDALISEVREHLANGYVGKAIYAIDRGPLAALETKHD